MKELVIALAFASLGLAGVAEATPMLNVTGSLGNATAAADEAPPTYPDNIPAGTLGKVGYLNLSGTGTRELVTFTLGGHGDAAFNNLFHVNGFASATGAATAVIDWTTGGTAIGTMQSLWMPVGLLDFMFTVNSTSPTIANNGSDNSLTAPNFGLFALDQTNLTQGNAFWIGLSDLAGEVPDYQDMVIKATVPEPGTLFLLGIGMLGVASSLRRRKV